MVSRSGEEGKNVFKANIFSNTSNTGVVFKNAVVTRHLAVFPTGDTRAVPPRLVSDRRPGPPGQGGAGQKSHSRENKFAPPGPGRGDSAVGRLRRQRPAPRHGPWGPQPHKGAQTSNPEGERGGASRRRPSLPRPSAPPPFAGATPDLPRPRGDRGATARAAPPPSPSQPEPPHLPRSGGLRSRSHRLRRPGSRRGALWGLESSRGPLCASAAERGTTTPTMPCSRSRATPPHRRFHVTPRLHFPTALAAPPSLRRHEPNWASGRGAGRVPARRRRRRRPLRIDSPASPVALVAGAASTTLLGCGAAGPRVQCPGRDTPSPSSSPVGATPPESALALRGRRSPRPRAAPRPGARSSAPALPLSPPPTLNMDSDSCAAAFHPEVSESCVPIAPNRLHPDPMLPEPDPRRPSAALPSPSYPSSPPGCPTPPPTRARARSSPPALSLVSLPRVSASSRRRFPQVAATTPPGLA